MLIYCKNCKKCIGMDLEDFFKEPDKKMERVTIESNRVGLCKKCFEVIG